MAQSTWDSRRALAVHILHTPLNCCDNIQTTQQKSHLFHRQQRRYNGTPIVLEPRKTPKGPSPLLLPALGPWCAPPGSLLPENTTGANCSGKRLRTIFSRIAYPFFLHSCLRNVDLHMLAVAAPGTCGTFFSPPTHKSIEQH